MLLNQDRSVISRTAGDGSTAQQASPYLPWVMARAQDHPRNTSAIFPYNILFLSDLDTAVLCVCPKFWAARAYRSLCLVLRKAEFMASR
jgi:hypothetical protein